MKFNNEFKNLISSILMTILIYSFIKLGGVLEGFGIFLIFGAMYKLKDEMRNKNEK